MLKISFSSICICLITAFTSNCFASELSRYSKIIGRPTSLFLCEDSHISQAKHFDFPVGGKTNPFFQINLGYCANPSSDAYELNPPKTPPSYHRMVDLPTTPIFRREVDPANADTVILRKCQQKIQEPAITKIANLIEQVVDLQNRLQEAQSIIDENANKNISSIKDGYCQFNDNFPLLTPTEIQIYYKKALENIKEQPDREIAEQKLNILWGQLLYNLKNDPRYLVEKYLQAALILRDQSKSILLDEHFEAILSAGMLHFYAFERQVDLYFLEDINQKLDYLLQTNSDYIQNMKGLNPMLGRLKAVPVLLHMLKINGTELLSTKTFAAVHWKQWQKYIHFLTSKQRRALRSHLVQGGYPESIRTIDINKYAIDKFMNALQISIVNNLEATEMDREHVDLFNSELLGPLRIAQTVH
jgi:hypothetical protein